MCIGNERAAVKHQLVLAAHLVDIGDWHSCFDGTRQHGRLTHTTLVSVERRTIDVDCHLCPGGALSREWAVGNPHVFANAERHRHTRDVIERVVVVTWREVTHLVEHRVIGQ